MILCKWVLRKPSGINLPLHNSYTEFKHKEGSQQAVFFVYKKQITNWRFIMTEIEMYGGDFDG